MTYEVQRIDDLYVDDSKSSDEEIQEFLNDAEDAGWSLVAVIPDHNVYDDDGNQTGMTGAKLVLHKP